MVDSDDFVVEDDEDDEDEDYIREDVDEKNGSSFSPSIKQNKYILRLSELFSFHKNRGV